jgi:CRP/FNR family transcriptional regulator
LNLNLYIEVAASTRKLLLHYQSFFTDGLECRTAALLLHIGEGASDELHLPVSQTKLASWLGISRGRLNRTLMKFQKQGLIRLDGPTLYILDRPGLTRIRDEVMTVKV